ncbi:MAG TPA: TIM-barrel domain-containing protein [Candidatus Sulfotelmatobacter sp.]|nr:TIM-barrel domain-containing protein [Candidatus Sulfotelmatobacter sp.]
MLRIKSLLTSLGTTTLLTFWQILFAVPTVSGADGSPAPEIQQVAPGIWRIRFGDPEQFTPTHFQTAPMDLAGLKEMTAGGQMPLNPDKILCQVSDRGCSVCLPMARNESIYGFGLHTELFDMTQSKNGATGRRVVLAPTDMPENDLGESHAPVPFYVSSEGYGVFVDTARFATFYTGNVSPIGAGPETGGNGAQTSVDDLYRARAQRVKTMLVDVPAAKGLDVYVFAGPTMLDAVERYNLFSGGGAMPPLWGLGVQYRGYVRYGAAQSLALAARIRDAHIPCDVWGVEPGWQSHAYSCTFVWDTNTFPDPDDFIQKMHAMGFRLNMWEHAFTHPSSPIHDELKPWSGNYLVWGGLVPDFASPEARKIFLKQNDASLFDRGIESVKLDECDFQPESASPWSFPLVTQFPSGLDGEQMHSLFGVLYQQTMLEPYNQKGLRTWGLVRNSQALAGPLPYVVYSDSYDHRCYVRGLVNEGFSGLLWAPEVRIADSLEDFYRRIETVIFSPDAMIDSWFIKNPPWDQINRNKNNKNELMPDRDAVAGTVRNLLQLRMSFIPYLYSAFNEYHATGKPPIRAMVLDWPKDWRVRQIDDQFMFGDSVLVAPMFAGDSSRQVYLPAGDWFNFWTHEKISGPATIEATNGIEQIPLFVKGGTLLPLADPVEHIKPDTCFDITVNIVGDQPADFTLYEDDGVTDGYANGEQNKIVLNASGASPSVSQSGNYHGPARYKIVNWKQF